MINQELIKFANQLADLSEPIIKKYFRKDFCESEKQDKSPVTLADKEAEEVIRETIKHNFPDHGIVGEEFEDFNKDADYKWILDPIDGTTSFVIGRPIFGTLIALAYKNKPLLGIINQPITQERWVGVKGQGATFNGQKITTRKCPSLNKAILCTTSPELFNNKDLQSFKKISAKTKYQNQGGAIYGGDCYSYALLASGLIDIVIESGLNNYDFAALIPIIQESGGKITDWQGKELGLDSDSKVIACGDKRVHNEILKCLTL